MAADSIRQGAPVPGGRWARLARLGSLAGGVAGNMLAEGARQFALGKRPKINDLLLTPANARLAMAAFAFASSTVLWAQAGPQPSLADTSRTPAEAPRRTYANACATCHDRGGFAVQVLRDRLGPQGAELHRRNSLDPDTIRMVVRHGMGAMPAMSRLEVSDAELDGIITELAKVRQP